MGCPSILTSRDFHPTIQSIRMSVIFHAAAWQSSAFSTVYMAAFNIGLAIVRSQSDLRIIDASSVTDEAKQCFRGATGISLCECSCGALPDNETTSRLSGSPTKEPDYHTRW